jgi:pyrroline-5-carboxylate reductase
MSTMDIHRRHHIADDLGIVGVGAIAEAIVTGLCEGKESPPTIHLSPRGAARTRRLAARYRRVPPERDSRLPDPPARRR